MTPIPHELIIRALALTRMTMEDITEIVPDGGWYEYEDDFSYPKFFYYLLSPEFIEKYNIIEQTGWGEPNECLFWLAIHEYQSWNSAPIVELLTKI
jgi:hypothetical protein